MPVNYVKMVYEGTHWHQYSKKLNDQLSWLENKLGPRGVMELLYDDNDIDCDVYKLPIEELSKRAIYEGRWFWLWIEDTSEITIDKLHKVAYFIFADDKIATEFKLKFA